MMTRDEIAEHYPDAKLLEPDYFDAAIVGVAEQAGCKAWVIYDPDLCVKALMTDDMTEEEALEYFEFNTAGAYVGEGTPMFLFRSR
jgi:hypothetical protein